MVFCQLGICDLAHSLFTRDSLDWPAIVPLVIMDKDGGDPGVVCIRSVHPLRLTDWRSEAWNLPPPKHTMDGGNPMILVWCDVVYRCSVVDDGSGLDTAIGRPTDWRTAPHLTAMAGILPPF